MVTASPIFITGSQRSGSSWLAHIIAAGRQIALLDEPFNHKKKSAGICAARFDHWFTYIAGHNSTAYFQPVADTFALRYNLAAELPALRALSGWRRVWPEYRQFMHWRGRGARPLVKQPTGLFMAEWVAKTFGVQVIVLVRHPAAFVYSCLRLGWGHNFADFTAQPQLMGDLLAAHEPEICEFAARSHDKVDELSLLWKALYHVAGQYRARYPEWIFLRHEDVAADPPGMFENLFQRLGLDFSAGVQRMIEEYSSPSNPVEVPVEAWKSLKRNSQASALLWKERLAPAEIERIYGRVADVSHLFYDEAEW